MCMLGVRWARIVADAVLERLEIGGNSLLGGQTIFYLECYAAHKTHMA